MSIWSTIGGAVGGVLGGPAGAAIGAGLAGGGGGDGGGGQAAPPPDLRNNQEVHNDYYYGGTKNGAADAQARYQGMGSQWAGMQAPGTNYGMADQSRQSQMDALNMERQAAMGNAPSQAQIMMRQGNDQAVANQMAMAAGARGPAAMAGAQQQAMGNASNMSTQNQNNMGSLRAQEMAQSRQAYGGMAAGMRGMDQNQAQYLSDLAMRQRQLGLQGQLGFEGMGQQVARDQNQMGMSYEDRLFGTQQAQNTLDAHSADRDTQAWSNVLNQAVDAQKTK